jgi:uncharacterized protein YjbI with pentapeptide repeats
MNSFPTITIIHDPRRFCCPSEIGSGYNPVMPDIGPPVMDREGLGPEPVVVTPRGHRLRCQASLPIDRLVREVIAKSKRGIVQITSEPGGGKTTALRYLQTALPGELQVECFDAHQVLEARQAAQMRLVVLMAATPLSDTEYVDAFALSPWTPDDCLEYLVKRHREQCASVIARLDRDQSVAVMAGSPQLLSLVMEAMARDQRLTDSREILRSYVRQMYPPGRVRDSLAIYGESRAPLSFTQRSWWRYDAVRQICMADWAATQLCQGIISPRRYDIRENAHLIPEIASIVRGLPAAIDFLNAILKSNHPLTVVPMAASIRLAADPDWRPAHAKKLHLVGANLAGAKWAGIDLTGSNLQGANLSNADLREAKLEGVNCAGADLSGAKLCEARLTRVRLAKANLFSADLSRVSANEADLSEANLTAANLRNAAFGRAQFFDANFTEAQCAEANFFGSTFVDAIFAHAVFSDVCFIAAKFQHSDLTESNCNGACFSGATLHECNLEGLEMPGAIFENANLTGSLFTASRMPGGNFHDANLTRTGLADVDWPNADLRGANFAEASFHMGSTRSGLVGSTIPSEGSRTGFYTDDFNDRSYKPPEEISKACLCGSNLIGAEVEGTDFYLVDLRRAKYSAEQGTHFSKTGAIL